ncbi:DEAD/DEAH box helicase family protein [Streptomyces sp. SID1328]|uniref:type III restriction-modification system endonuclease n=1 Tax=Streptomyces sp. SID1328 TaxID=2690250 RepID=UPI0013694A0B|nr:DEAD/DEAH box helicase family protein [Streptomyces sp. SID1328]MYV40864.1 DEAD/DEAH box helicase family protein [Streptomyces sp. SID1328]
MKTPKLHFSAKLPHQQKAIEAVCDLFHGQETGGSLFTVSDPTTDLFTPAAGVGNRLTLFPDQLGENLRAVQLRNNLAPSPDPDTDNLNFTIEMETGTGKTYVYLRTIYELNKRYGFTKFVVVVPSVAIKEGVHKSLQIMEDHFKALYSGTPLHFFPYDSSQLGQVRNFAYSAGIEVMIVTAAAINKQATARIYQVSEQTGGVAPIDLIKQTRPILIVDEPQSVDGGPQGRGKQALGAMHPLFTLRYSATHIDKYDMVYKLDAVDAYQEGLVKQIEVAGGAVENAHSRAYVRLESISKKKNDFSARVEVDEAVPGGGVRRVVKTVQPGYLLEQVTRRSIYEGLQIGEISKAKGAEFLQLRGGGIDKHLQIGETHGDIPQLERARHLIRKTIREHLDKELELRPKGIKVLTLFFIERVARYRTYGESGEPIKGDYALIFEKEYQDLKKHQKYATLLGDVDLSSEAQDVHNGYFAQDKKGTWKDVSEGTGQDGADAERAYDLIMKDKERLLSLETPLKFIFSHSALREGWDNPNVFQICSLREMGTDRQRRQTIGRGLRLAVNQEGERVQGFDVNTLTVVATESYEQFAAELQAEIEVDSKITFGRVESHQFASLPSPDGSGEPIGFEASQRLYKHLQDEGYLDAKGKIDGEVLAEAVEAKTFMLPAEYEPLTAQVAAVLEKRAKGMKINDRDKRHSVKVRKQVFESAEFRELWERIKHKTTYRVDFDADKVIEDCIRGLREARRISPARMRFSKAKVVIGEGGLDTADESTSSPETVDLGNVPMPDILSELADRTQLTRRSIQRILAASGRLNDFRLNPQEFIDIAADVITARKREALVNGVKYLKLGDNEFYTQELFAEEELHGYLGKNLIAAKRSVYEEVRYDSETERKFVEDLEKADDVRVYAKLPGWFKISTPLGSYNPDWAIVRETHDGQQHLYLVIETKGTLQEELLRPEEAGKIRCGGKHFGSLGTGVTFAQSDSWHNVPFMA